MSRLFRERALIALAPQFAALARVGPAPRRRVRAQSVLPCAPGGGDAPWRGAVASLAQFVAGLPKSGSDVSVVLSNHLVRYTVVQASAALRADEALAYARHRFARVHGERAKNWEVRLDAGPARAPRLACAVDRDLLEAIRACLPRRGSARLVSVQPYLMAAFNQWRGLVGNAPVWLLLLEAGRACVGRLERGQWTAARNLKGDFGAPQRWRELLERERCLTAADERRPGALVHAPLYGAGSAPDMEPWRLRLLGAAAPGAGTTHDNAALAMALCAL